MKYLYIALGVIIAELGVIIYQMMNLELITK